MSKCGKGCMPECEYFTTGGCISPFNCMYKEESGYINSATSGTVICTGGMNMTNEEISKIIANIKLKTSFDGGDELWGQTLFLIEELQVENAALRERLEKAVELPRIERLFNGKVGSYKVVYQDKNNRITSEYYSEEKREVAEARLAELKGEKE